MKNGTVTKFMFEQVNRHDSHKHEKIGYNISTLSFHKTPQHPPFGK